MVLSDWFCITTLLAIRFCTKANNNFQTNCQPAQSTKLKIYYFSFQCTGNKLFKFINTNVVLVR